MSLKSAKNILWFAVALFSLEVFSGNLSATACIYKDANGRLACADTNMYDCKSNLKGTPEYNTTCADLESGTTPGKDSRPDYMGDYKYRSCLNQCGSRCSGYKTQTGAESCISSCQSGCTR